MFFILTMEQKYGKINKIIVLLGVQMKRLLGVFLTIIFILLMVAALIVVAVSAIDWFSYSSFYTHANKVFLIPGINEGYIPQGFEYDAETDKYLLSGYMSDERASRIYVVEDSGESTCVELKNEDGSDYMGESGGIAHYGEYIYISSSKGLDVFSYTDIKNGAEEVCRLGTLLTYNEPEYCTIYNGYLFVGSFYELGEEDVLEHEYNVTPSGEVNPAIITVFQLDDEAEFYVDPTPKAVITTTAMVQGMCFTDKNEIILSTSFGLSPSKLYIYDTSELSEDPSFTTFSGTCNGQEFSFEGVKKYHLESKNIKETIKAPPMAEEIFYKDGKIFMMNESAGNKYIFGKFTTGLYTYSYAYRAA